MLFVNRRVGADKERFTRVRRVILVTFCRAKTGRFNLINFERFVPFVRYKVFVYKIELFLYTRACVVLRLLYVRSTNRTASKSLLIFFTHFGRSGRNCYRNIRRWNSVSGWSVFTRRMRARSVLEIFKMVNPRERWLFSDVNVVKEREPLTDLLTSSLLVFGREEYD